MDKPPHAHHAGCGCDPKEIQRGNEYSLFKNIDVDKVRCLNEATPKSGARVFRPYDLRHDNTKFVDSADDEQLIFYVPFTGSVKLKSIIVIGGDEKNSPSHVQVFINRDDIDFSNVGDLKKTMAQEFDLGYDARGDLEHQTKLTKFSNCNSVTLFFDRNHGAPCTRICWIGFKGDYTSMNRAPVIAQYELRPQPADHQKTEAHTGGRMGV